MKKILIIEPNCTGGLNLLESAARMGLEKHIVTHENIFVESYDQDIKDMIDYTLFTDFRDPDRATKEITEYCRHNSIDGILAAFEFMSDLVVKICHELNMPSHSVDKAAALRRKDYMHKLFSQYNVPCARYEVAQTYQDCVDLSKKFDFPYIVKPVSNAGSCGVIGIFNGSELKTAYDEIRKFDIEFPHGISLNRTILIQEYLLGPEYSVEIAIYEDDITILSITEKITTTGKYFAELGHIAPAVLNDETANSLRHIAKTAVMALGMKNGIAHVEAKITEHGPKIIEVGARLPGDHIPKLLQFGQGVDMGKIYLQIALGIQPDCSHGIDRYASISFLTSNRIGTIKQISIPEHVKEQVEEIKLYKTIGDEINAPTNNIERIGHIIVTGDTYDLTKKMIKDCLEDIKIVID